MHALQLPRLSGAGMEMAAERSTVPSRKSFQLSLLSKHCYMST